MNYEQQIGEFYVLKTLQTFYPKDLVWYGNYQLEKKMGERNYSKTSRICYISDCQFPEHFSEGHWPIMCCLYKQWCWYNEHSCENNSTKDPNNKYYPNHKIPIEPQLLNQILSVKMGNYFNILLKH